MAGIYETIRQISQRHEAAVSVAVRNVANARELSVDADLVISSASLIKVPMLVEAMRRVREGSLSSEEPFVLSDLQRVKGSGVMRYLHEGATLTLQDLLTLMIIVSDNTATNMLVDILGIDSVNSTMQGMGYSRTRLQRKMYDWQMIDRGLDNLCTAGEMADLLARIGRREALGEAWDGKMLDILYHQQDCDKLGLFLPQGVKLANKTGSREGILHDCGIITSGDLSYSIAVLTKDAPSRGEAIMAIAEISRAIYDWQVQ